jgi:acylphosphatase
VIARRLVVSGRVQGVGYRYGTVRRAEAAGVVGWVRNRSDGSVEAFVQGAAPDVEALVEWCRHGPRNAAVSGLEVEVAAVDAALAGFEQRATG